MIHKSKSLEDLQEKYANTDLGAIVVVSSDSDQSAHFDQTQSKDDPVIQSPDESGAEYQESTNATSNEEAIHNSKFYFSPRVKQKTSSSSSKASSSSTLYKNISAYQVKFNANLKAKMKIDLDRIYSGKSMKKFVSFESSERQENYDYLFSADVATPSLEVPEVFDLFGSTCSLGNRSNSLTEKADYKNSASLSNNNFSCVANNRLKNSVSPMISKKNDLKEHIPLHGIISKKNKHMNNRSLSSFSGDEA